MQRLLDRGALVTGGAHGIGLAIAKRLASEGAVVTVVDVNAELGAQRAVEIVDSGGRAHFVHADIADWDAIESSVAAAFTFAGDLSVLVNCAQYFAFPRQLELVSQEDWEKCEATGPKATFRFMQLSYPHLQASGHGSVINFTSGAAVEGTRFTGPYASAKGAILALTRVAANEWSRQGVRVNALSPFATTASDLPLDSSHPSLYDVIIEQSPMNRGGNSDLDIAPVAAFLASDDASFITGTVIHADGGLAELSSVDYSESPGVFEQVTPTA